MTVKVLCHAMPVVQPSPFFPTAVAMRPAIAGGVRDVFAGGVAGVFGPIVRPAVTLSLGDRLNAAGLADRLSGQGALLHPFLGGIKSQSIIRDPSGIYRGPEGQPLAQVRLRDGNTAYVDPNTNRYFLTNEQPAFLGLAAIAPNIVHTLPARDLPLGSRFSNSHFSDADVRALTYPRPFSVLSGPLQIGG